MPSCSRAVGAWVAAGLLLGLAPAHAVPSNPDPGYGTQGRTWVAPAVATDGAGPPAALLARADGSTLVLERGRLWRVTAGGALDAAFGYGEAGVANGCLLADACTGVVLGRPANAAAGGIYVPFAVHGATAARIGVLRLRADGRRDPAFGAAGVAVMQRADVGAPPAPAAVGDGREGRVVVVGLMRIPRAVGPPPSAFEDLPSVYLARFLADGRPDLAHGDAGIHKTELRGDGALAAFVLPDGRALVAAAPPVAVVDGATRYESYVTRLIAEGEVDTAFVAWREEDVDPIRPRTVLVDRDGSVLVAGQREARLTFEALRLRGDGGLAFDYGVGGFVAALGFDACVVASYAGAALDARGRLVLGGTLEGCPDGRARASVVRLASNGFPDATFAQRGEASFLDGYGTRGRDVAVDAQGRIVVAASAQLREATASGRDERLALYGLRGGDGDGPAGPPQRTAVEYVHAAFGHYFVTADADEIAGLDAAPASGWARTGQTFRVWDAAAAPPYAPVCRFWSGATWAPKSSHFYTPYAAECALVQADPAWRFERNAFAVRLPEGGVPGAGVCAFGAVPLYRAFNGGRGGAPNHRYTTDARVLDAMIAQGWTMEGEAVTRVFACVPQP